MSLAALLELSKKALEPLTADQKKRLKEARKRMAEHDKRIEEECRRRIPTQEQLDKVVNWGTLYG
ncbi:hypothetical protein D9M71_433020 [compost metagenome]